MNIYKSVLQKLRVEHGYSQSELAKLSGVNLRTLQDFDQGRKKMGNAKGEMIYRLCTTLNCSLDELIDEDITNIQIDIEHSVNDKHIISYSKSLTDIHLYGQYYRFPVIVKNEKIDMSRIHPLKQSLVNNINKELAREENVVSIMLFGSSVTMKCNLDSDIDLAIRLNENSISDTVKNDISEKVQELSDWNADILWFDRLSKDDRVYHDICKGVQIV